VCNKIAALSSGVTKARAFATNSRFFADFNYPLAELIAAGGDD
jgi:hypothetical protein